jgi:hypothetical protein
MRQIPAMGQPTKFQLGLGDDVLGENFWLFLTAGANGLVLQSIVTNTLVRAELVVAARLCFHYMRLIVRAGNSPIRRPVLN